MLSIVTIALDAMPYIGWHMEIFTKLQIPWHWYVVEGVSGNTADTSWCRSMEPRLSRDGTTEYLNSIRNHPNVTIIQGEKWSNKTEMMNEATLRIEQPGVLMQVDADEIHEASNLEKIVSLFESRTDLCAIRLPCQFFVGPDLVVEGQDCYGNKPNEWLRAFRFEPGQSWERHEPPMLSGCNGHIMPRQEAEMLGLRFLHFAYATEGQVRLKAEFYPYENLLEKWRKLQAHTHFPDNLQKFFDWSDDRAMVNRL